MAIRQIRIWPDPALSEIAAPVTVFDQEIETLVTDMLSLIHI